MNQTRSVLIHCGHFGSALIAAVVLAGCDASALNENRARGDRDAPESSGVWATPEGITLQPLGKAQGYGLDKESAILLPRTKIGYADASGMTLYSYGKDPSGRSLCVGECEKLWPPALAEADAEPLGDWSVIRRDDGSSQWALKGKPLYRYAKDVDIGSIAGNSPKVFGRGPNVGQRGSWRGPTPKDEPVPEGWTVALAYPVADITMPPAIAIKEVADAFGLILVTERGNTVYVGKAGMKNEAQLCAASPCPWAPLPAPQLASPIGDFNFIARDDGIRQWSWKGQPLYTYAGDFAAGFANGVNVNPNWEVAYVLRYFMPPDVSVQETPRLGKVLANAHGQTLYRRDAFIFQSGSGHSLRRGTPVRPAVGRDLGIDPRCDAKCSAQWRPFLASAHAKPAAYWTLYSRADGSKQWAYQGFALWTYAGDERPGEINGNDAFDIRVPARADTKIDIGTPYDGAAALYWAAAIP